MKQPSEHMIGRARQLRQDQTHPERILWYALRSRRLADLKFRRQRPIGPYVADFICIEHKLVIELDGDSHDASRYEYDVERQQWLEQRGYRVLRITNDDVLRELENVLDGIRKAIGQ